MGIVKVIARDIAVPLGIGAILFALRDSMTQRWCAVNPTPCVPESVNAVDRIVFQLGSIRADFASNVIQNTLIVLIIAIPMLVGLARRYAWDQIIRDILGFVTVSVWNFAVMEVARAVVQRPRPLVFRSPLEDGANPYQYNSFYSGHTSFTALATLALYYYARRAAPERAGLHRFLLGTAIVLPLIVGALRVWGGRHYPTDVLCGALIGWSLALVHSRVRGSQGCQTPF